MAIDPGLRRLALGTMLGAIPGHDVPPWATDLLGEGLAGYTLFSRNVGSPKRLAETCGELRGAGPDVLLAIDEEGGDVTRLAHATGSPYPGNAALGAVGDPRLTAQVYRAIGADLAAAGINLDLAPTVDVNTADDNPIIGTRSFGADPAKVAEHSAAAVTGLQAAGVAACAKHFPGHGATLADSHLELPTVPAPMRVLRERDLPPFAAVIGADVRSIMTAHIRVPALTGRGPATFSRRALVDLLRREYGFTGTVVSDALEMKGAAAVAGGLGPAAVWALVAGVDLLCVGARVDAATIELVATAIVEAIGHELPLARVEEAARRTAELAAWTRAAAPADPPTWPGTAAPADPAATPRLTPGDRAAAPEGPATAPGDPAAWTRAAAAGGPAGSSGKAGSFGSGPGWELGYQVARRAVAVEGSPAGFDRALVVRLGSPSTIAEGRVPWGLAAHLPDGADRLSVVAAETSADDLVVAAAGRPVVLVGRHLHRDPAARHLAEALAARLPLAVVEMGWPASWRPAGARAFVRTFGASHANGRAAADALGLSPTLRSMAGAS